MSELVLLVHAVATFAMTGIIWFVHVVHYPLFQSVGRAEFSAYSASHSRLTTRVMAPPMLAELATAVLLLRFRPDAVDLCPVLAGLALTFVIWLATMGLSVPKHTRLASGFDEPTWRALCRGNWVRTVAWSARAVLVVVMLSMALAA